MQSDTHATSLLKSLSNTSRMEAEEQALGGDSETPLLGLHWFLKILKGSLMKGGFRDDFPPCDPP